MQVCQLLDALTAYVLERSGFAVQRPVYPREEFKDGVELEDDDSAVLKPQLSDEPTATQANDDDLYPIGVSAAAAESSVSPAPSAAAAVVVDPTRQVGKTDLHGKDIHKPQIRFSKPSN